MASLQDLTDPTTMGVDPSDENPLTKLVGGALNSLATLPQRAIQNSQFSLDTGNYDPRVPVEAALTAMTGGVAGTGEGGVALGAGPIRAYHGSPHDFDAFDLSKIGTGEGAQAYGHGLYFAENEGTANAYKEALGGKGLDVRTTVEKHLPDASLSQDDLSAIYRAALSSDKDPQAAAKSVQMAVSGLRDPNVSFMGPPGEKGQKIANAISDLREQGRGRMYQVDINADPEHFLDWDKPLSEQPQAVQDALKAKGIDASDPNLRQKIDEAKGLRLHPPSGGPTVYPPDIPDIKGAGASKFLSQAGIPGIKYLDQGSRAAGDGSRNYVVFNDKLVDIIKKYGMAGISMLPPAMAAEVSKYVKPVDHDPFEGT